MLRILFYITFLFVASAVALFAGSSDAQDFISGQVQKVDPDHLSFIIIRSENDNQKKACELTIHIRPAKDNSYIIQKGEPSLPGFVAPHKLIKAWGTWKDSDKLVLIATDLKPCSTGGCSDPTGILSRMKNFLGKSSKGRGRSSGSGTGSGTGSGSGSGGGSGGGRGGKR